MRFTSLTAVFPHVIALALTSCGSDGPTADELNATAKPLPGASSTAQTSSPTSSTPTLAPSTTTSTVAGTSTVNTNTTSAPPTATTTATTATSTASADTGTQPAESTTSVATSTEPVNTSTSPEETTDVATETTEDVTSTEVAESTEPVPAGPYSPRTGSFKMLVYSKTAGWRHDDAIDAGRLMLSAIATEQGFEVKFTETNEDITVEGLSQYEIVFFLNSTGDIFTDQEQEQYEEWMTTHNGAFAGVHSATDTENGWGFYSDVTGQYYNGHTPSPDTQGEIQWETANINHPAARGLPSPWARQEEWYKFNQSANWSTKPGFSILSRVTLNDDGGTRPVSFVREWSNFRSFYTSLGHAGRTFQDADVKKHIAAGIMWAVRREAEIK